MIFLNNLYLVVSIHEEGTSSIRYQVSLIPDSLIFKAHFPGQPIMPGACIVQMVEELFEMWTGLEVEIYKINNLKFLSVVSPEILTNLEVILDVKEQTVEKTHLKADVIARDVVYTRMSLILSKKKSYE